MLKKGIAFAALVVLASFVGLMAYCEHLENPVGEYATYADAVEAGAVARGWIPSFVPPSAVHIRDAHNLDTNNQWLQFHVPELDAMAIVAGMRAVSEHDTRCVQPGRRSVALRRLGKRPDLSNRSDVSTFLHIERGRALCVAVDWSSLMEFAWTARR